MQTERRTERSSLNKDMVVAQSNQLVESSYSLTLNEQRLLYAAAAMHDSRKPIPEKGTVTVTAADFADVFGIDRDHAYEALDDAARRFYNRSIRLIGKGPKGSIERNVRWVWMCEYRKNEGAVLIGFSPAIAPHLTLLREQFTILKLEQVGALSSQYAMRIFALCGQYRSIKERSFTVEEFRSMLDLGDKYESVNELRRRIIDPSVEEISAETDMALSYEPKRKGRKIIGFRFIIGFNEQPRLL